MLLKHLRFGLLTVGILMAVNNTSNANNLSPQNFDTLYSLAKSENLAVLNNAISRGLYIDSTNHNGDTGLCVAAKRRDKTAFKTFARLGANINHPCTWEISGYSDFIREVAYKQPIKNMDTATNAKHLTKSMSLKNKLLIGTGVIAAGAGAALAFGGGGGGGSSSDANCVHGYYKEANVCACYEGYAGSNCSTCDEGYGFHNTSTCHKNLVCVRGEQVGSSCKCPEGYDGITCDVCREGYGREGGSEDCVRKSPKVTGNSLNDNFNSTGSVTVDNTKFVEVYGLFYDSDKTPHHYVLDKSLFANFFQDYSKSQKETVFVVTDANINIKNVSDSDIYGLYSNNAEKIYNNYINLNSSIVFITPQYYEDNPEFIDNLVQDKLDVWEAEYAQRHTDAYGDSVYPSEEELEEKRAEFKKELMDELGSYGKQDEGSIGSVATITIDNVGDGVVYGLFGNKELYSADIGNKPGKGSLAKLTSVIDITNQGDGNAYGIFNNNKDPSTANIYHYEKHIPAEDGYGAVDLFSNTKVINTNGKGNTYGLYALGKLESSGQVMAGADAGNAYGIYTEGGKIQHEKEMNEKEIKAGSTAFSTTGNAYGLYAQGGEIENGRIVKAYTTAGTGNAYGIYIEKTKDKDAKLTNTSGIQVESAGGNAYGIYNIGGTVTNSTQRYEIMVTAKEGTAYGIYSDGGTIDNSGHIYVYGKDDDNSFGIYATNGAKVTNHGEFVFNINGISANRENYDNMWTEDKNGLKMVNGGYAIYVTNGATFKNEGGITSNSVLYLGETGTQLGKNGKFNATSLAGGLEVANSVVSDGFDDEYVVSEAINAEDVSNLKLSSESVLFDAKLQGSDVILNKKDFDTVVKNKDMAEFLENNYALANNEQLFKELKSKTSAKELNLTLNKISGEDIISRFTNEDLLMQQELDFNINNQLFKLKENNFAFSGNVASNSFDTNGAQTRYAVSGKKIGDMHLGVGMSIAQISSDNGHGNNKRQGQNYQFMMPLQWKNDNGFNTIITPKLAYSYGTYSRDGYNDVDYKGKIEKQLMGVSAQSKYKFDLFGFNITPTSEANLTAYKTKISEDAKQYSLNSEDNLTYSATLGFGAFAEKEYNLSKDNKLNFMFGAMLYHEFANPYNIKLNINGMKGSFALQNETYKDNYMVLRSKFSYDLNNISIYGDFLSHIDNKYRSRIDLGFKYAF